MSKITTATALAKLAGFFSAVQKTDPDFLDDLSDVLPTEIAKAGNDPSADFRGAQQRVPGRGQIGTGPTEPASGRGARTMTRTYHNPDLQNRPQIGLAAQYIDFDALFPEGDEDSSFLNKARSLLIQARRRTIKADIAETMGGDDMSGRDTALREAAELLSQAAKILSAACDDGAETDEYPDATKALTDRLALLNRKVRKSAGDSSVTGPRGMSVPDLMNAIAGGGTRKAADPTAMPPEMAPAFLKSATTSLEDRIEDAEATDRITEDEALKAYEMLQLRGLVKAGRVPQDTLSEALKRAPDRIKELFEYGYVSQGYFTNA